MSERKDFLPYLNAQRYEIAGYKDNPKVFPWMVDTLLDRYDSLGAEIISENQVETYDCLDYLLDASLVEGEITGEPMPLARVFLLAATRSIIRAQAGRSDEEIARDTDGTNQQKLAQQAQKKAYQYVYGNLAHLIIKGKSA
jgi:hypothetical protein